MKYINGQKIYKYKLVKSGEEYATYKSAIQEPLKTTLAYAALLGFLKNKNDTMRNGKLGEYYLVRKDFDSDIIELKRKEAKRIRDEMESGILANKIIDLFTTVSDNGFFIIDYLEYSNFYGNGENRVEVCKCDFDEFKDAKMLTRRQAYSPNEPITIVKFDEPKTIEVKLCDNDDNFGIRQIKNACGFCIWERKLKIFVTK